jgi:hypothetical protein
MERVNFFQTFGRNCEKTALHAIHLIMMCVFKHSSAVWEYIFLYLVVTSSSKYAYSANPKEEHQMFYFYLFHYVMPLTCAMRSDCEK